MNKMNAIMKKTYISPEALTVNLTMSNIIATSGSRTLYVDDSDGTIKGDVISDEDADADGLVKGSRNLWDNEW